MFDIHCHLIYGIDDGADSLDESLRMLRLASHSGTKGIAATPHCNIPGSYQNYWNSALYNRLCEIRTAAKAEQIPIEIYSGQEIFCTEDMLQLFEKRKLITLNNSRYPLVEFAFDEYSTDVFRRLEKLIAVGLIPVVAHPERYYFVHEDYTTLLHMKDIGCLLQMNKGSYSGYFGSEAEDVCNYMLDRELIDCIASDGHSPFSRSPYLEDVSEILSDEYSFDYVDLLMRANPMNIICNRPVEHY